MKYLWLYAIYDILEIRLFSDANSSKPFKTLEGAKSKKIRTGQEASGGSSSGSDVSMGLTDEQKRVMEENRQRALAKRQQKAANNGPGAGAPSTKTASNPLQTQQQSLVVSPNPVKGSFYGQVLNQCTW